MRLKSFVAEASANLAYGLILFSVCVEACQKESSVHIRTLAFAIVSTHDDQVKGVTNTSKVVFLNLDAQHRQCVNGMDSKNEKTLSQLTLRLLGS